MVPLLARMRPVAGHTRADRTRKRSNRAPRPSVARLERRDLLSSFTVSGQSNIYGAGLTVPPDPGGGGGGILPSLVNLSALGNPQAVEFLHVSGEVSGWVGGPDPYTGPDGGPYWGGVTNVPAYGGISGIQDFHATIFLVGVFLGPTGQPAAPPPTLNVTNANNITSFSPLRVCASAQT
jgi:hypothetical protein